MRKTKTVLPLLAAGLYFAFSLLGCHAARAAPAPERTCLIEAAWTEAKGLPPRDVAAVMWVLVNRSRAPGWPATVCGVYRQRGQFQGRRSGLPRPGSAAGMAALAEIESEADLVGSGAAPDPTRGALYFYCPRQRVGMGLLSPPSFASVGSWRARIGPFEFYGAQHRKETRNGRRKRPEAAGPRENAGGHAVQDRRDRHNRQRPGAHRAPGRRA